MKVVVALVRHETNTFSPLPTVLGSFSRGTHGSGPVYADDAKQACLNTNSAAAAYLDLAEKLGAEVDFAIVANAVPSGVVTREAFDSIADSVVASVKKGCDAVMLDLHGAMVAQGYPDAEGELLKRLRAVLPVGVPIVVALDFHANFSRELIQNATIITGYCTYPHIDIYQTGARAGKTLQALLKKEVEPVILWRRLPMLTHMLRQTPAMQPMKDIMDRAIAAEADGRVLNASVFGGFPLSDIPYAGLSVVLVVDKKKKAQGKQLLDELCNLAWERREDFIFPIEPLEQSIARAKQLADGPIILVDHGDNCGAGGPTDNMAVLREVMRQGLKNVVAGPFWDPAAVGQLIQAGVGAEVTLDIGGKTDVPALEIKGEPLNVRARVVKITDGNYIVTGPMFTGMRLSIGKTAVIEVDGILIFVCEKPQEPYDTGLFTHAGVDPAKKKYVLIKSRQHFRAGFGPLAKHIVLVAGPGVCSSDYSQFPFKHLSRPIYPLDENAQIGQGEEIV
ncbi:M81 family metallopeptidase [Paralcaligenes ureilyticus]|uniref:Microcystinase C n=1 Tax=Paralcaligenes ureilyticus TaxID=627131 RepID=A0A4R3M8C4_9BURK|nr:M81 family metallopeptidase [Paralcaligenes ureilyticus]TCT09764.1 microcystin degradation protein MlrC [Paralcaligenes ureilyticus]